MEKHDELDKIFVDKNEPIDKKDIVEILEKFVKIDKVGTINFTQAGEGLNDNVKVLIYLVCRKAMVLKGLISSEEEAVGPKEISTATGVGLSNAKKTTNQTFVKMLSKEKGKYSIPNYNLRKIKKIILGK